tara:strand:- start:290 stop:928 length:639 start_codon:yes stop_codon:yes gene_type:complete
MSKEAKKPVVNPPQIISDAELKATQIGAKGWSKGQQDQEEAVASVGDVLNAKTTLQQYNEMQSQWSLTYVEENPEASKEKVSQQRSRFFREALKYAGIKKPTAQNDVAENRAENRTQRAERVEKYEKLGTAELEKRLQGAKNAIGNATTKKAGTLAAAQMNEILEAQDNLKKKAEAKHEEAKKALLSKVRDLIKEANFATLQKVEKVLLGRI